VAQRERLVSGPLFRYFALADFISVILIVITGAAVRLTGSGLGCPDWPTCYRHHLTSPPGGLHFHQFIEYGNRLVTVMSTVVTLVTFAASSFAVPGAST
jgi:cytochrome c oxidase assembly protein subunit 15